MTTLRRDPIALTVQERGRAASQQKLTTATTLLAAIGMLTHCGRPNRICAASSRYASHPAHSEHASPSQPAGPHAAIMQQMLVHGSTRNCDRAVIGAPKATPPPCWPPRPQYQPMSCLSPRAARPKRRAARLARNRTSRPLAQVYEAIIANAPRHEPARGLGGSCF